MVATPEAVCVAESVPHVAPLHPLPVSVQSTPKLLPSFVTVGVNACVNPFCTLALPGEMVTVRTGAATTVIVAAAVFVLSVVLAAVNVTVAGLGTDPGAV